MIEWLNWTELGAIVFRPLRYCTDTGIWHFTICLLPESSVTGKTVILLRWKLESWAFDSEIEGEILDGSQEFKPLGREPRDWDDSLIELALSQGRLRNLRRWNARSGQTTLDSEVKQQVCGSEKLVSQGSKLKGWDGTVKASVLSIFFFPQSPHLSTGFQFLQLYPPFLI